MSDGSRQLTGYRVARYRGLAGMTQKQLADAAGYSKSYISAIENGDRAINSRALLHALADALRVSPADLTGQPYQALTAADLTHYVVAPQIRDALEEPDEGPVTPRPLDQLELLADRSMRARMNCDMAGIGDNLPTLLAETRVLWFDQGNREGGILLVKAAVTGCLAVKAAGFIDLAVRLSDLATTAANSIGDPVCMAAARFAAAQCALASARRHRSARTALEGIDDLDRLTRTRIPNNVLNDVMAWMGLLHLHAGLSVAGNSGDSDAHLAAADVLSRNVVGNPWRMEFSRANVLTWGVGIALENGNPEQAPELARRVDVSQLITPQRRSRLYLDTGRGLHLTGDYDGATRALLAADREAPGDLRTRPTAVELVAHMVRAAGVRGGSEALRDLAVKVGVDPLALDT